MLFGFFLGPLQREDSRLVYFRINR